MKTVFTILLLLLNVTLFSQQLKLTQPVRYLALGDSYTAGTSIESSESWPNQVYYRLAVAGYQREKIQIIAAAGWRTDNLTRAISEQKPSSDFNLVSLLIGVNNQYQGAPVEHYENDFENILKTAISLAGGKSNAVFILSVPDYSYTPFGKGFSEASREIDKYNSINREIAQRYNIAYFDITPISRMGLDNPELIASDGLHPSELMYKLWVDMIMNHIRNNNPMETIINKNVLIDEIEIFPNPVRNNVTIKISSANVSEISIISIYSVTGELKYRRDCTFNNSSDNFNFDLSHLSAGLYLLEVIAGSKKITSKIIIE